jgi:excisionase family DNA binding protein
MSDIIHTVEHAAARLRLHPKTVLRFIRDGKLRATRVGKAWRILHSDLEAFAGAPAAAPAPRAPPRVTAIADVPGVTPEAAQRIAVALSATLTGRIARPDPIQLDTVYDPARSHLKVIVVGAALETAALLQILHAYAGALP